MKYGALPAIVVVAAVALSAAGKLSWALSAADILNAFFVAVFISVTWFYADETAMMRRTGSEELRLLQQSTSAALARLVFRPMPAQPQVHRSSRSVDARIDASEIGLEIVNAGTRAATDVQLAVLFFQSRLEVGGVPDSEREPLSIPVIVALLPGETRTLRSPHHWANLNYSSSSFAARIRGSYWNGSESVLVDEVIDISAHLSQAVRVRMVEIFD